jgi:tagatose 1,6-diphosphate aldolase
MTSDASWPPSASAGTGVAKTAAPTAGLLRAGVRAAGKRWGLRRLADAQGHFSMVAIDQRPPIFSLLARRLGVPVESVPFAQVLALKRVLAEAFANEASAMLVDPNYGYPAAADVLNPARGLVMTLEDHRTTPDRRSSSIADWSAAKIRAIGGDAVKLLAWYHPRASSAVREHQQAFVQQVGEDCARHDLPFVLELLLYPLGTDDAAAYREDSAKRSDEVLHSVEHFAHPRYQVDLFKLESPIAMAQLPAPGTAADAACTAAFDALHRACGDRPWVMLSAGAAPQEFERVVAYAARAGAAGFLAGRALWADALEHWPDEDAVRRHLQSQGVPRLNALRALLKAQGRPWAAPAWTPDVHVEGDFSRAR